MNDTRKYRRDPSDAELSADWAQQVLADLPAAGTGCRTTDQRLAAGQIHALLAISYRLAELAQAVQDREALDELTEAVRDAPETVGIMLARLTEAIRDVSAGAATLGVTGPALTGVPA